MMASPVSPAGGEMTHYRYDTSRVLGGAARTGPPGSGCRPERGGDRAQHWHQPALVDPLAAVATRTWHGGDQAALRTTPQDCPRGSTPRCRRRPRPSLTLRWMSTAPAGNRPAARALAPCFCARSCVGWAFRVTIDADGAGERPLPTRRGNC